MEQENNATGAYEVLITAEELASRLGCHVYTVHAKAKKGEIPFVSIGFGSHRPRRRYNYEEVLKALAGGNGGER